MKGHHPLPNMSHDPYLLEEELYDYQQLSLETLVCAILLSLTGLVALIGNSLMLRAWIKYPRLRTDFYTVFFALSIVDILYVLLGVPIAIMDMFPEINPYTSELSCKFVRYWVHACGFVTATLLVVLSTLRAILLTNRNTLPRPRAKHLVVVSAICFVMIFLTSIPTTSLYTLYNGHLCYYESNIENTQIWLLHSFSTFVPLLLIAIMYFIAYLLGKRFFADSYSPRETQKSRLVNCVVLGFFITQVPYRILSVYETTIDQGDEALALKLVMIFDFLQCLFVADKALRPILCSKLTVDLARAFDEIINCQGCQNYCSPDHPIQQQFIHTQNNVDYDGGLTGSVEGAVGFQDPEGIDDDEEQPSPLVDYPERSRSRINVDRSISTSSTASTSSQAPLIRNHSHSSESERNGNSVV